MNRYATLSPDAYARLLARFWDKVERHEHGCWEWTASTTPDGYGQFWHERGMWRAHRFAYLLNVGPIPDGLDLDHTCRNTRCVNPAHLEPVTRRENTVRGLSARGFDETCSRGHAWTVENTITRTDGRRACRECKRARQRAWHRSRN